MERERTARKTRPPKGLIKDAEGAPRRIKAKKGVVIVMIVLLLLGFFSSPLIYLQLKGMEAKVEKVRLDIEGDTCNVTVKLDLSGVPGEVQSPLTLKFRNGSAEFSYKDEEAAGTLGEEELRSMIDSGEVEVRGAFKVKPIPIEFEKSRKVDVSFVTDALRTINATNVTLAPTFSGFIRVSFDVEADIDARLELTIIGTEARIEGPFGISECSIDSLSLRTDGTGSAVVYIPTLTFISLALWGKQVTLECFGIEAKVLLPFS